MKMIPSIFNHSILIVLFLLSTSTGFSQFPQITWYYDVKDMSFGNLAIGDIDEDDKPEIVFSCYRNDSTVYALNAEGRYSNYLMQNYLFYSSVPYKTVFFIKVHTNID